jgi:hypothetical protein
VSGTHGDDYRHPLSRLDCLAARPRARNFDTMLQVEEYRGVEQTGAQMTPPGGHFQSSLSRIEKFHLLTDYDILSSLAADMQHRERSVMQHHNCRFQGHPVLLLNGPNLKSSSRSG